MGKIIAALLSFIFIGLGQIYNKQYKKAVTLWVLIIILAIVTTIFYHLLFGPFWLIIWLYNVYDAYKNYRHK